MNETCLHWFRITSTPSIARPRNGRGQRSWCRPRAAFVKASELQGEAMHAPVTPPLVFRVSCQKAENLK